jgi:hypothetical protein
MYWRLVCCNAKATIPTACNCFSVTYHTAAFLNGFIPHASVSEPTAFCIQQKGNALLINLTSARGKRNRSSSWALGEDPFATMPRAAANSRLSDDDGNPLDDDDPEIPIAPFSKSADRGLSLEEQAAFEKEAVKGFGSIKWEAVGNPSSARVVIGYAASLGWEQFKREAAFFRSKMQEKLGNQKPDVGTLFNYFFGPETPMFSLYKEHACFLNYETFLRFLFNYVLSCAYQLSPRQLFDKNSFLKQTNGLDKEAYNKHWNFIGNACLPKRHERYRSTALSTPGLNPLWRRHEDLLNDEARKFFIEGFPHELETTLDDDKAHIENRGYSAGLKNVKHVRDNRNGHTCHTLVHSFSQVPIHISWERVGGDSSEKAAQRIYSSAINPVAAPGGGNMHRCEVSMDRGYYLQATLEWIMKSGAKIHASTVKRQHCIPMTFDQKKTANDKRKHIPVKGAKTLFTMRGKFADRYLYCLCYRDGKAHNTLGLSTTHGEVPQWDLVPYNAGDINNWYDNRQITKEEVYMKAFESVRTDFDETKKESDYVQVSDELLQEILATDIRPLTVGQGDPGWFEMRKFALTSSTTDVSIGSCSGNEDFLGHPEAWAQLALVLGHNTALPAEEDDAEEAEATEATDTAVDETRDPSDAQDSSHNSDDDESSGNGRQDQEAATLRFSLEDIMNDDGRASSALHTIQNNETDDRFLSDARSILTKLGKNLSKAADEGKKNETDLKSFKTLLQADKRFRPFVFKGRAEHVKIGKKLGVTFRNERSNLMILEDINEFLQSHPSATIAAAEPSGGVAPNLRREMTQRKKALQGKDKLRCATYSAAWLEPLEGKAKMWSLRGHELEREIMRSCLEEHRDPDVLSPILLKEACRAPIVEKKGERRYARDSIDFLAVARDLGRNKDKEDSFQADPDSSSDSSVHEFVIGVEVKSRLSFKRDQAERLFADQVRHRLGLDRTPREMKTKYFEVDADSDEFRALVPDRHEAIQTIHHAYVYDLEVVLLLVGDDDSGVLYGIFVNISDEVRSIYGKVLEDIYKVSLEWIYKPRANEEDVDKPTDEELSDTILPCIPVNGAALDLQSFKMQVAVWRGINLTLPRYPIPRLKGVLPVPFSRWNMKKGGSDSTTLLIDNNAPSVPNQGSNQSIVCARMFMIQFVWIHRLFQIGGAKEDLDFYSCLQRCRDSATMRSSMKGTLLAIAKHIEILLNGHDVDLMAEQMASSLAIASSPANQRQTRSAAETETLVLPSFDTGKTPKGKVKKQIEAMELKSRQNKLDGNGQRYLDRLKRCTGHHVHRLTESFEERGAGAEGTCAHCNKRTNDYCILCKRWLCYKKSAEAEKLDGWVPQVKLKVGGKTLYVNNSCFRIGHAEAIHEHLSETNTSLRLKYN